MANKLYLRYGSYVEGSIVWETPMEFNPMIFKPLFIPERISGRDLRSINFSHLKSLRSKSYEVVISANDLLSTTKLNYLKEFLVAEVCQYNLTDLNWSTQGVFVTFENSEAIPFESISNHKQLLKIKFNLIQKYPD